MFDLLPVIGTFEGVDIVMDKLISEDPIIDWPPSVFMSLALMPYPDVHSVERLIVRDIYYYHLNSTFSVLRPPFERPKMASYYWGTGS